MATPSDSPLAQGLDATLHRLGTLYPTTIDLSLGRLLRLLDALGNPHASLPPVVHVAGTNGKGSTVAFITAMLAAAGHRVHRYTSPHLVRFNERIQLAGEDIDDGYLTACLETVERVNGDAPITFFEATTCAALLAFAETPADYLVLETGLGGRLDTTNVVDRPLVTAITPIAMDHENFLGDSLAQIAGEKAGILKPGVACVVARQDPIAAAVIAERAAELDCRTYVQDRDWRVAATDTGLRYESADGMTDLPQPALHGDHQMTNAGVALAAMDLLGIDGAARAAGLRRVSWRGRLQRLTTGPLVAALPDGWELWLDGGHNPAAGAALADAVAGWRGEGWRVVLIFGVLATKDATGFLTPLAPHADCLTAVTAPGMALTADEAAAAAERAGFAVVSTAASVGAAVGDAANGRAGQKPQGTRVLICGSLYLAGEVLADNA